MDWTTIESDPGVFTELLEKIGVRGAEVHELYALEPALLRELGPVYGLIFLFKWTPELSGHRASEVSPNVYFAQQIINNACATVALLSILLNQKDSDLDIGDQLRQLKAFTEDFTPEMRGVAISNADGIRLAHNSFAAPEANLSDKETVKAGEKDDVYHFISFIYSDGALWELDGLQAGPIKCCACTKDGWLDCAVEHINGRISAYAAQEIRFNLMALIKDRRMPLRDRIKDIDKQLQASKQLDPSVHEFLKNERSRVTETLSVLATERYMWRAENLRRRHNYVPFIFNLLQVLAERDELLSLESNAKVTTRNSEM